MPTRPLYKPTVSNAYDVKGMDELRQQDAADNAIYKEYRARARAVVKDHQPYPKGEFSGRGIVTVAGGDKYFPPAWVMINMLRHFGCTLPVYVYHLGKEEFTPAIQSAVADLENVTLIDGHKQCAKHGFKPLPGWPMKCFAIIDSPFEQVLFIDGDNVPVRNPEYLFRTRQFKAPVSEGGGALFWPDLPGQQLGPSRSIWTICGVPYRPEPEFESGQIVLHKEKCWGPLQVAMHLNLNGAFYYKHVWGDKETFHMAWRMCEQPYTMIPHDLIRLQHTMVQHDLDGHKLFQHRNLAKWSLQGMNICEAGFIYEELCLQYLYKFGKYISMQTINEKFVDGDPEVRRLETMVIPCDRYELRFLSSRTDMYHLQLKPDHSIVCEEYPPLIEWHIRQRGKQVFLTLHSFEGYVFELAQKSRECWDGFWEDQHIHYRLRAL